jgi:hypothetical protein
MRVLVRIGLSTALALALCTGAVAQRQSTTAPVVITVPSGSRVITTGQPQAATFTSIREGINARTQPPLLSTGSATINTLAAGGYPVPGLGFDYVHYAAVNRDLGVRALIDPAAQQQLALTRQIRRETPAATGIMLPFYTAPQVVVVTSPPPVVIIQQAAAPTAPERVEPEGHIVREERPAAPAEPPRELAELVLVRIDGKLLFAIGFSVRDTEVVYITREGIRRSLPLAELDFEFTRRLNEERGTSLRLPS